MSTLKIWREIQSLLKLPRPISSLTNIGSIRNFIPAQLDIGFRRWSEYGLKYIHQSFEKGTMKSFGQLRNNFLLPKTDFFTYLQLRHLLTAQTDWAKIANPTGSEQFLMHLQEMMRQKSSPDSTSNSYFWTQITQYKLNRDGRLRCIKRYQWKTGT